LTGCEKDEPCRDPVREVANRFVASFADLYLKTLDAVTDVADLFLNNKSIATAAGLNPTASDAASRGLALAGVVGGAFGDAERVAARLSSGQAADLASHLGFGRRVKDAPFSSHGQQVFTNGRHFISQDIDMHLGPNATWKMFDRAGNRLGTFDALLNRIGK
jgi:hypothetical protein